MASSRKTGEKPKGATRLDGRDARNYRSWIAYLRLDRILAVAFWSPRRHRGADWGHFFSNPLLAGRSTRKESNVTACALSFARFHRGKFTHPVSLQRAWRHALFLAVKPDSSARLHSHGCGRCVASVYSDYVFSIALVWRTCGTLWRQTSTGPRSDHRRDWLCSFCRSRSWRALLE